MKKPRNFKFLIWLVSPLGGYNGSAWLPKCRGCNRMEYSGSAALGDSFPRADSVSQRGVTAGQGAGISKVDLFIVRAYKIITKESILNSEHIQGSLSSNKGTKVHPQYAAIFNKISKIFNLLLNRGLVGDGMTISKKSAIELFHRFQQILKEIELNFEHSAYAKYFNKINDNLFQIKNSSDLVDDPYWEMLSDNIALVYNSSTGKIMTQNRKKPTKQKANVTANNHKINEELDSIELDNMTENEFINISTTVSNNFPFNMDNNNSNNNRKRKISIDDNNVEELLRYTNLNKKSKHNKDDDDDDDQKNKTKNVVDSRNNTDTNDTNVDEVKLTLQEVKDSFMTIINEKDKRIQALENEIALQKQETVWLRKMLIEDMGYVRNVLKGMSQK